MKFKALIFFLLFASAAMAQNEKFVPQSLGGAPTVKNFVQGVIKGNLGISLASFPDTLTPNLNNRIKNEDGLLIRVKDTLFLRDTIAKKWVNLSGSGSGSSSNGVDSVTQIGSILYVWEAGVSTPHDTKTFFTFTPNYNSKMFLMYIDGVLSDSTASGVKDAYGLGGIRIVDSLGNVYIDGSSVSGTDSFAYRSDLRVWAADSTYYIDCSLKQCDTIYWSGSGGSGGSTFSPDTLEAAIATKQNALSGTGIVKSTSGTISYLTDPLPIANGGTGTGTPGLVAGTNITSITGTWPNQTINASGSGGSSSNSVTEQKSYIHGEYYADKQINTTTGTITSNVGTAVTDYLHVAGGESITISVPNGYSNVTIYGWTYDTTLTAISEIRSNALIGTTLKTYTFTTPSNARFLNIYVKYGGLDFAKALSIKSTNTITYNTPITPEQFTGSKSAQIQKALDFARFTSTGVTLNGSYSIDSSLILSSGSTLILDNARLVLDSGSHTNIIRNEAVANPARIFARGNRDIKIIGIGNSSIEGSKEAWGTDNPTGVGTEQWRSIGIFFANVENFEIKGFTLKNTNSWGSCFEQCRVGLIDNLTIHQDSTHGNQDGINLRDGTNRVTVSNIKGHTWDDLIACTNLAIGPNIKILGSTIYELHATNLDIHSIIIKDIQRDTTGFFGGIYSAIYKGGILLLCEDGRRVHDVTIDGITGPQQIQVGFTLANYVVTTPATVNDMYNIGVSNTGIANINFARPIKNSSFYNVADSTTGGALNAQYFAGSVNVARKAYQKGWEFYEIFGTQNLGSNTNVPVEIQTNNITRQAIKTDGKMAFGMASTTPTYNYQFEAVAASALTHTGLFAPAMTNNQKSYLMFGKSASNNEAFYWAYNHNSTSSLRYLSLQSNLVAPGNNSLAITADGNVGIGTVTPSQKLSILNTDNNGSANSLIDFTNNVALQGFLGTGSATTSNSDYRSNMVLSATNNLFLTATSSAIRMRAGGITLANQIAKLKSNGIRVGPNDDTDPSAYLHFSAGTATAETAPIRFTAGVTPSVAVSGDLSTNSSNDLFYANGAAVTGKILVVRLNSSSASTLTLATTYTHYVFTGTTSTWTLPAVSATESHVFYIKNRGSGSITLGTAAAANELYITSATNTLTIAAGTAVMILSDGTYWMVE